MRDTLYRFHGHAKPERRSVLNLAPTDKGVGDGVAVLRLYDPIDSWGGDWGVSASEFADALDGLGDDVTDIHLHINSPGGEVFEGIAIANQLRSHRAKVTAVVDGLAASAASFISSAADQTVMGQNTQLMIHDAWGLGIGNAADLRDLAGRLDHLSNNIASMYTAKAGGTVEEWRAAMLAETWYSADEAVAAGLADSIQGDQVAEPTNSFDLSAFKYAGRDEAPTPPIPTAPGCQCGANGVALGSDYDHKDECPTKAPPVPEPSTMSAFQERRHRANARKMRDIAAAAKR